jgi:hypothetical protein
MVEMNAVATRAKAEEARPLRLALLASVPVTGLLEAAYYFGGIQGVRDETPLRAAAVGTAGAAVVAVLMWLWCRNSHSSQLGARSVRLGVLAAVSFLGFWIGVFGPVCVTAMVVGRAAVQAGRVGAGWFAVVAGALVAVAGTVLCLLGAS